MPADERQGETLAGDPRVERALAAFREHYVRAAPFREDRKQAEELVLEARPAVEDLLFAADQGAVDLQGFEHHEGLAMVTLLGRRAAELAITPTAALALVPALLEGFRAVECPLPEAAGTHLQALCIEGYVASRGDRAQQEAGHRAAGAVPVVRIAPGCIALVLAGRHDPERLGEVVERFGRELFETDARACVVDLSRMKEPTADRAVEVFGAHATARMLGTRCVFAGVSEGWLDAARQARVDVELLEREPSFDKALERALGLCGLEIRRIPKWRELWGR
jgi:hypothetical protein